MSRGSHLPARTVLFVTAFALSRAAHGQVVHAAAATEKAGAATGIVTTVAPVPPVRVAPATIHPGASLSVKSERSRALASRVLIVEDELPWAGNSAQEILAANGIAYDQAGSAQMATIDLTPYALVIVGSAQPDAFYTAWNTSFSRFEAYVSGGGTLWIGTATSVSGLTDPLLPGGVTLHDDIYAQYGNVAATAHPWVAGVSSPFEGLWASHGELVNLPAGSTVVTTSATTGNPTLADYRVGSGRVLVTTLTLEIGWSYGWSEAPILRNSLLDMYSSAPAASADLAVTKTDGVTTATPGGSVTYTITASNAGPSSALGATVADTFPAALTATWTCVGAGGGTCTASGSGNINDTVDLPAGGSVTYTASATVSASATGTLSNTATVAAPAGLTDPTPGNNSATDSDTLTASADLAVTKIAGAGKAFPGGSLTYTIVASNAGPSSAPGTLVVDNFPAGLTCTWTCTGAACAAASGSGNLSQSIDLAPEARVTYSASCVVAMGATGPIVNTATVTPGAGVVDPTAGNAASTVEVALGDSSIPLLGSTGLLLFAFAFALGGWMLLRRG